MDILPYVIPRTLWMEQWQPNLGTLQILSRFLQFCARSWLKIKVISVSHLLAALGQTYKSELQSNLLLHVLCVVPVAVFAPIAISQGMRRCVLASGTHILIYGTVGDCPMLNLPEETFLHVFQCLLHDPRNFRNEPHSNEDFIDDFEAYDGSLAIWPPPALDSVSRTCRAFYRIT